MTLRLVAAAAVVLSMLAADAQAATGRPVRLSVVSQPVGEVMETLAFMSGLPVTTIGKPSGAVENWSVTGDGLSAFEQLGEVAGLFVAYDGTRVIVAPHTEVTTTVFSDGGRDWRKVEETVRALFPRFPDDALQHDPASASIIVRAPAAFTAAVSPVLNRSARRTVRIYRGGRLQVLDLSGTN